MKLQAMRIPPCVRGKHEELAVAQEVRARVAAVADMDDVFLEPQADRRGAHAVARVIHLAENSKTVYARVFGYGVASILMVHIIINIGMSIGLVPTIGIPLPFFSYGGSSVLSFTTMMFVLMNHYSYRTNILT